MWNAPHLHCVHCNTFLSNFIDFYFSKKGCRGRFSARKHCHAPKREASQRPQQCGDVWGPAGMHKTCRGAVFPCFCWFCHDHQHPRRPLSLTSTSTSALRSEFLPFPLSPMIFLIFFHHFIHVFFIFE